MSDFSGLEQSFTLPALSPLLDDGFLPGSLPQSPTLRTRSYDLRLDEIEFRRLHAADEIAAIQKLRAEIQLPGAALADPRFMTREKKETGRGLSAHSNGATISSGQ
jgi:hypothetical protein